MTAPTNIFPIPGQKARRAIGVRDGVTARPWLCSLSHRRARYPFLRGWAQNPGQQGIFRFPGRTLQKYAFRAAVGAEGLNSGSIHSFGHGH